MSIINAVILDKKNQYVKLIAFVSVNNGMTERVQKVNAIHSSYRGFK